ncbi:MAG: hypothetical protein IPM88_11970 [Nitrospira sp.]|nr:hypothetical protein [Nitrospira sp.]
MVYLAGIPMQQAAAMSLIIVATSSLLGAWEYGRQGQVKAKAVLAFSWTGRSVRGRARSGIAWFARKSCWCCSDSCCWSERR